MILPSCKLRFLKTYSLSAKELMAIFHSHNMRLIKLNAHELAKYMSDIECEKRLIRKAQRRTALLLLIPIRLIPPFHPMSGSRP